MNVRKTVLNTIIIYAQRFATAGFALVTTPLVLNALGVEDFGLYTLTVGFVGFLSFLTWSLSSCTQRYIAFALGGKKENLSSIFSTAFFIHSIYGLLLIVVIASVGLFLHHKMLSIPADRVEVGRVILILVSVLTFFTVITVPFIGVLRAHEDFKRIAIFGIAESCLKLIAAALLFLIDHERLTYYSTMLVLVSSIIFLLHAAVVLRTYHDIKIRASLLDFGLMKEMLSFFGWNMLGAMAIVSRNQGVAVILNIFFGVIRNAAYGIALQVSAAMAILSQGVIGAISPQIVKAAGAGDQTRMIYLMRTMSKFAIFSISLVAIPVFFETPLLLELWLHVVPEDTITYVRLIIVFGQVMLLSAGIQTVFDGLGKVKTYNILVSVVLILNLPVSYLLFHMGFASYSIIVVGMMLELLSLGLRLKLLQREISFSIMEFVIDTFLRVLPPTMVVSIIIYIFKTMPFNPYFELVLSFGITLILYPTFIFFWSLEPAQREMAKAAVGSFLKRF